MVQSVGAGSRSDHRHSHSHHGKPGRSQAVRRACAIPTNRAATDVSATATSTSTATRIQSVIDSALREQCSINAKSFAIFTLDEDGRTAVHLSRDLEHRNAQIFRMSKVWKDLHQAYECDPSEEPQDDHNYDGHMVLNDGEASASEDSRRSTPSSTCGSRTRLTGKRKVRTKNRVRFSESPRSRKRPRSTSGSQSLADDKEDVSELESSAANQPDRFRLDDTDALVRFYRQAFEHIQQLALKQILKAWIKKVEPKKQTNYPYISSNPDDDNSQKGSRKRYDGPKVPPWWPLKDDVRHKEPDHLSKDERLRLAVHMLRLLKYDEHHPNGWVDLLQSATVDLSLKFEREPPERSKHRWELLTEVYSVARMEEDFRTGGRDSDYVNVTVLHKEPFPAKRARQASSHSDTNSYRKALVVDDDEEDELYEDGDAGKDMKALGQTYTLPCASALIEPTMHMNIRDQPQEFDYPHRQAAIMERGPHFSGGVSEYETQDNNALPDGSTRALENTDDYQVRYLEQLPLTSPRSYIEPPPLPVQQAYAYGTKHQQQPLEPSEVGWKPGGEDYSAWNIPSSTPESSFCAHSSASVGSSSSAMCPASPTAGFPGRMEWSYAPAPYQSNLQSSVAAPYQRLDPGTSGLITPAVAAPMYVHPAVPEIHGVRAQPPPGSIYPGTAFRTGSLNHPHGLPFTHGQSLF